MVVAVVGVPAGLEARFDHLQELKRSGAVDFVESQPGRVVLYWRGMKAQEVKQVTLQAEAVVPGAFTGAASRAYVYYSDEHKVWAKGVQVVVQPRRGRAGGNTARAGSSPGSGRLGKGGGAWVVLADHDMQG